LLIFFRFWEYFTKWENNSLIWRSRLHPDDRNRVIQNLEDSYAGTSFGRMNFVF
jgi:hypothetical protein